MKSLREDGSYTGGLVRCKGLVQQVEMITYHRRIQDHYIIITLITHRNIIETLVP